MTPEGEGPALGASSSGDLERPDQTTLPTVLIVSLTAVVLTATGVLLHSLSDRQHQAQPGTRFQFHIEPKPLIRALEDWTSIAGVEIDVRTTDGSNGPITTRVSGIYEPETALCLMLEQTGYSYEYLKPNHVYVVTLQEPLKQEIKSRPPSLAADCPKEDINSLPSSTQRAKALPSTQTN
jgi:hypothetical protein